MDVAGLVHAVVMLPRPRGSFAIAFVVAFAAAGPSLSQQGANVDELSAEATDPTASLMSFQLNDWYTSGFRDLDGSANQVVFRMALPFALADTHHIFRVTQPYVTSSPSGATGFTDTTIFDLMVFNERWGRWGLGVSGTLPTGEAGLTTDKWTAGPALGFVNSSAQHYNWGLFTQTFFSFAGESGAQSVRLMNIQPIYSYQLGEGRSVGLGNSALVYDFESSRWSSLMVSVNYGQVITFAGHKWRPNVEAGYDFNNGFGNQRWVLRAGIVLLLPT